ncbi:pRL2-8 [Streptomyces lavendulae]|nr:pRL2-8 [Streptomyces lavendulae]
MTTAAMVTPPGQCPQCWQHAHDKSIHRRLKPREDCPQCVDHMVNGHPTIVPKKPSRWW